MAGKHVIVVGAGIVGASVAYHLARNGAADDVRVTLVDAREPGGVASPCSFGWVNASYRNARPYYELRVRAMALWDQLLAERPDLPYRRSGVLYLDERDFTFAEFYAQHRDWGYDLAWVDATDIRRMEPNLEKVPERGLFARLEGAVDADLAAVRLAAHVKALGGRVVCRSPVERLALAGGRVSGVVCGGETIAGDDVVLAAGTATEALATKAGVRVPLQSSPGLLIHTSVAAPQIGHLILADDVHFRQRIDGRFTAGEDFGGGSINEAPEEGSRQLLARIRGWLRRPEGIELAGYTVGHRPKPIDGHPVIGRPADLDGLYVTVMHSGATLAPAVGELASREILTSARDPVLAPFGVERFAEAGVSAAE